MQNQQVLITGGTGGLGRGVVPLVLAQGAKVTVPYVSEASLKELQQVLPQGDFERIAFVKVNLQDEEMVKELILKLGRVDVLIHLVGGFSMGSVEDYSFADWKQDFDLNLHTTFLVCKYCLKKMRQWGYGRIITVGSRGAVQPAAQLGAYCASKAGVVALTQVIAEETKNTNITANCVLPSVIDTPANREAMGSDNAESWVSPSSLGEVICFLASAAAKDLRGAAIPVYGNA
jgi:NAD(P)-dependent dehydrogenase (short-subunit alcohol dehydrogenase family)